MAANLGRDPDRAAAAVNAAVEAVLQGKGLSAASAAATNAWTQAGGRPPSWRLTFWGLLLDEPQYLVLGVVLVVAQALWLSPAGVLTLLLDLLLLPPLVLKVARTRHLSRVGIVAPGVLVKTARFYAQRGERYSATYEFEHEGAHFVSRVAGDTPQDVLVLFDPADPRRAVVVPATPPS